jgi:allantoicase
MTDAHVNLAARRLGAGVIAASDEFFGEKENLLRPEPPAFRPRTFGPKGQIVDGWESRRRREPGHDWALIRLGAPGVIHTVVVDTAHFTGNFPAECSVAPPRVTRPPRSCRTRGARGCRSCRAAR